MDTKHDTHLAWTDDIDGTPGYTRCALSYQSSTSTSDPTKVTCARCRELMIAEENNLDAYELRETADLDFGGDLEAAKNHLLAVRAMLHQGCACRQ